jgi:chorismate dehydratase
LTKIIFREFLGFEPVWSNAVPDIGQMLAEADAALVIGDPALRLSAAGDTPLKVFDLAELWHQHTGLGFVFAMWMTRRENISIDLAAARDEGLRHIGDIAANYASDTGLSRDEMQRYLTENISYSIDDSMQQGLDLYFRLAARHRLIPRSAESRYI